MPEEPDPEPQAKSPVGWGPIAALLISFGAYLISQIALFVPFIFIALADRNQDVQAVINNNSWLQLALTGLSSAVILLVLKLFLKARNKSFRDLGFAKLKKTDFGWMALGLVVYYGLLIAALALANLIPGFNGEQTQAIGFESANGWQLVLVFIGLVIIPPFAEESLFRGFLYRGMSARWPRVLSALIVSILFAAAHMQWNVAIDVFILSIIMIVLLEKTKNLWVCIFLHGIKNLLAFLALFVFVN
jgi:uncharacterized protein